MKEEQILVTGGAGYIGSHAVKLLLQKGYNVIVIDNLVYGHRQALPENVILVQGDIGDKTITRKIFNEYNIKAVLHFAAYAYVGESVSSPAKYYQNNLAASLNLLDVMMDCGCYNLIFSSTCASYGNPVYVPIDENHPQSPINPYGQSKLMLEKIIMDYNKAYKLNYVFLRYFNASGASADGSIGEDHNPETHLIPLIIDAVKGVRKNVTVFGTDYDTPDGTCIRDYIHVTDLAQAHILALNHLENNKESIACNLGTGKGWSVNEVIRSVETVTGLKVPVVYGTRREGDPPQLVANPTLAKSILGWEAKFKSIDDIITTAWKWHNNEKNGKYELLTEKNNLVL